MKKLLLLQLYIFYVNIELYKSILTHNVNLIIFLLATKDQIFISLMLLAILVNKLIPYGIWACNFTIE